MDVAVDKFRQLYSECVTEAKITIMCGYGYKDLLYLRITYIYMDCQIADF